MCRGGNKSQGFLFQLEDLKPRVKYKYMYRLWPENISKCVQFQILRKTKPLNILLNNNLQFRNITYGLACDSYHSSVNFLHSE